MRSSETSLVPLTKGGCQGLGRPCIFTCGIVLDKRSSELLNEREGDAGRDAALTVHLCTAQKCYLL